MALSPRCGDFFGGGDCLRCAETIDMDTYQEFNVCGRPSCPSVLCTNVRHGALGYSDAGQEDRQAALSTNGHKSQTRRGNQARVGKSQGSKTIAARHGVMLDDSSPIKVAQYYTQLPDKKLLAQKLKKAIAVASEHYLRKEE